MELSEYLALREHVSVSDAEALRRTKTVSPPQDATELALRAAYVILNGGMSWNIARTIWARMHTALLEHGNVGTTFHHPKKRAAINAIMANQDAHFTAFLAAASDGPEEIIAFCEALPHVGSITKFHLAKNLGVDCAKPDVWLVRVADASGETPHGLCSRLSRCSGDSIAVIDFVIWRACQQGIWKASVQGNRSMKRDLESDATDTGAERGRDDDEKASV